MKENIIDIYRELYYEQMDLAIKEHRMNDIYGIVSGIPVYYWNYQKEFIKEVVLSLTEDIKGIYFYGKGVTGKSMSAAYLLKQYIMKDSLLLAFKYSLSGYWLDYMTMIEYLRKHDSRADFIEHIFIKKSFIVLDDFGRTYGADSDFVINTVTRLCKSFLEKGGRLIITSNIKYEEVGDVFCLKLKSMFDIFLNRIELTEKFC